MPRGTTAWYGKTHMDSKACSSLANATTQFRLAFKISETMAAEYDGLTIQLLLLPSDELKTYLAQASNTP